MNTPDSLVYSLIVHIKQHRKPSSDKSTAVLVKTVEDQLLKPRKKTIEDLKRELQQALDSDVVLSTIIRQQHSEEDIRGCFANLLAALNAPQ